MNEKVRLTFTKIKMFVVENKRISIIFFLSSILILFFTLRPSIDDDKNILKPLEGDKELAESDSLEITDYSETTSSLKEELTNLEKKQVEEPKTPIPKNKPLAPPKKPKKKEIKKSIDLSVSQSINLLHTTLKKIVNSNIDNIKVQSVIRNTYNTERMLTLIIGDTWKKSSSKEQIALKKIFEEYIAKNYILRFRGIKNLEFGKLEINQAGKNYRMAKTKLIINSKDEVPISYLFSQNNNSWKIFDVLIDGSISEIATKKSEFQNFTNQGNLRPLLEALRKKNLTLLSN